MYKWSKHNLHHLDSKQSPEEATVLRGTNLEHARVHNLRTVLEMARLYGPISRADTARRTGLTAQTVSNLVSVLLEQGLLLEVGHRQCPRGRSSTLLELAA